MSEKVRVGTNKLTFTVSAFDYPREDFATAVVDVPIYAKPDNILKGQRSMSVEAGMPEDFNEKVKPRIASVRRHARSILQGRRAKC